jgi:hypothetical protein
MMRCENCRPLLLEYLYDVLEADEHQAIEAHLKDCPACQEGLVQAKGQQQLLAAAAKMEFPNVRFTAPSAAVQSAPQAGESGEQAVTPNVLLLQRPARPRRWRHWLVAAAVLLALGAAIPGVWFSHEYTRTEQIVAAGDQRIRQAKNDFDDAQKELTALPAQTRARLEGIEQAQRDAQLRVQVQGPASLRAGAPTEYRIYTTNLNGQPAAAKVSVEVKDRGQALGKPVEVAEAGPGLYRLTLPPDLPVKPGSQPTLVVSARRDNGSAADLREELQLAAPVYVTHLEIDRPMYQVGDRVHFRSLTLDRFSLKPAEEDLALQYVLTLPGGAQQVIAQGKTALQDETTHSPLLGPDKKPLRGVGAGSVHLDDNWPGGEYALTVRDLTGRTPEQRRKFIVNKYRKPNLRMELDYSRKSYGPGDEVAARCKVKYLDGRPVANCIVMSGVHIDGKSYGADGHLSTRQFISRTDAEGIVIVRFKLPDQMERGLGTLTVNFTPPGLLDSIVRPIPIVLKDLDVEFYPEGGDLVAGLPTRVYFQVRTKLDKPADLRGQLLEDDKPLGGTVETLASEKDPELNQGMGRFEFTPKAGHKYTLKIDTPVGITKHYPLPDIKADGVVLSLPQGVVGADESIPVTVRSTSKRNLLVGVYCRGRLLDSTELSAIHFTGNEAHAVLKPAGGAGGVCRVTVFEVLPGEGARRQLRPSAERLLYRQPAERVELALKPDQSTYVPRQTVRMGVEATTEKGQPAPAVVLLRVVDKSVLTLADDKTLRSMLTHFLLTTEVRRPEELEYADFLLGSHPRAAEALDLLLGTQGWRRFAEQDPGKFRHDQKEEAERLLVTIGQSQPQTTDLTRQELARVQEQSQQRTTELREQLTHAQREAKEADEDHDYRAALAALASYDDFIHRARFVGAPALGALLMLAALVCLLLGLGRRLARALPYYVGAAACVAAAVLLVQANLNVGPPALHGPDREVAMMMAPSAEEKAAEPAPPPRADEGAAHDRADQNAAAGKGGGIANRGNMMRPPMVGGGGPMAKMAKPMAQMAPQGGGPGMPAPGMAPGGVGMPADPGRMLDAFAQRKGDGAQQDQRRLMDKQKDAAPRAMMMKKMDPAFLQPGMGINGGMMGIGGGGAGPAAPGGMMGFGGGMPGAAPMGRPGPIGMGGRFGPADMEEVRKRAIAAMPPLVVREYRHARADGPADQRHDFAETLYWHPVLVLDGGKKEISFDLGDSLGDFEVTAFVHTLDGRLGSATKMLTSVLPLTVQPRTPLEVTAGDTLTLPVAVANNTSQARTAQVLVGEHAHLSLVDGGPSASLSVPAGSAARHLFRFRPITQEGTASLAFTAQAEGSPADTVRTTFRIAPEGFPIAGSHSDVLEKSATADVVLPNDWIKGTLKCQVQVYPSTLADLQKGLEGLLREPNGCFEQTSTSNYPNLLILQYLKESDQAKPEIERHARELLDRGYQKLLAFECTNPQKNARQGYEWFGGTAPAHEALTAYGLMEFRDMARVRDVDPAMLQRTQGYLLGQRDGKGGFRRNPRALDTFGRAPEAITNAYIVWALTEGGKDDDVTTELKALHEQAKSSKDPYFLSLVANSLINRAKTADAATLLKKVTEVQKPDGHLDAEQTSITGSGGRDLQIETTALAVLGWLKANPGEFNAPVQKAIRWIGQQRGGYGGFGSTQSTILALKALILYTKANKKTPEPGELHLFVGERQVGTLPFAAGITEPLTLNVPDAESTLKPGKNTLRVEITGKNVFPYTLSWTYQTRQPASAENCPVKLSAKLDHPDAREGETVRVNVHVENASGKGQGMAVAILGLPGGLTVPEDMKQLKDYTRPPADGQRPLVSYFEIRGRELVLYWRDLAPDQKIDVPIDLLCRIPGQYSGPASRAYLYYNADAKHWVEPLKVNIAAKAN